MSLETRMNIRAALALKDEAAKMNLKKGCVAIAARALGADIDFVDIINLNEKSQTNDHLVFGRGLFCEETMVFNRENQIKELGKILFQSSVEATGVVVGHILAVGRHNSSGTSIADGHAIAVPNINTLPRDIRKKLKKDKRALIVDTNSDLVVRSMGVADLEKSVNDALRGGAVAYSYRMGISSRF